MARPGVVSPTGQISREKALEGLPGDLSFEVAEQISKFEESGYKNLSAKSKAIADTTGLYEDQLARAPDLQSFINISMEMLKDPTYGEFLTKRGSTPDGVMQNIQQVMTQNPQNGLDVLKRRAVSGADTLRQSLVERGTPTALGKLQNELQALLDQGVSPDDPRIRQYNQRIEKEISKPAVAGGTTVNVRTEQAYSGEVAKLAARQDIELADRAAAIPQNIAKIDDYTNKVGYSERTHVPIEPKLSAQWFLKMEELVKPALENVMNDTILFYPPKFKNIYRHWIGNIKDWCISRQLS